MIGANIPRIGGNVRIDPTAFIHPTACIYGDVEIAAHASVWCNVVIRAESERVVVGPRTNVQDFVMIHIGSSTGTIIGADCSITHHCTLHGCTIGDATLIGIGSTIMDGCVIGENSIIAGHAFLKEGTVIPPNSIVMGSPAEVKRTRDASGPNRVNAFYYRKNAEAFANGEFRVWSRADFQAEAAALAAEIARGKG
jgi:carbonic anhydrase/acetyltransferase-like protein (isoleucine patch superfamily)